MSIRARRIFIGLAAAVIVSWMGSALLCWLCLGLTADTFVLGIQSGPLLAANLVKHLLHPERHFAGLEPPQVVSLLKRDFGLGVTVSDGRRLYDLVVEKGYRHALDLGTAKGYAALWIGLAMKKTGGKVITIEIDPEVAAIAREHFRQAGLGSVIDSRINDALLEIPKIPGEFDFVFMDVGAPLNKKLLDLFYTRILPGGVIAAHNAITFRFGQADYLDAITTDPNLITSFIPTLSGGISLTFKKASQTATEVP